MADALFNKAPILNAIKKGQLDAVIRTKDPRKVITKDAIGMFEKRDADLIYEEVEITKRIETKYKKSSKKKNKVQNKVSRIIRPISGKKLGEKIVIGYEESEKKGNFKKQTTTEKAVKTVKAWSDILRWKAMSIGKVKFVKYEEEYANEKKQELCVITTLLNHKLETILKIMHSRWIIENQGFRVLKDRYNLNHCYVGEINAIRVINEIIMLIFNLLTMYVDVRTREIRESGMTKRILKKIFENELMQDKKIYLMYATDIKASI